MNSFPITLQRWPTSFFNIILNLMNLNIFEGFHFIAIIIKTKLQIGPSMSSWNLFKLASESFLYNPSSFI